MERIKQIADAETSRIAPTTTLSRCKSNTPAPPISRVTANRTTYASPMDVTDMPYLMSKLGSQFPVRQKDPPSAPQKVIGDGRYRYTIRRVRTGLRRSRIHPAIANSSPTDL